MTSIWIDIIHKKRTCFILQQQQQQANCVGKRKRALAAGTRNNASAGPHATHATTPRFYRTCGRSFSLTFEGTDHRTVPGQHHFSVHAANARRPAVPRSAAVSLRGVALRCVVIYIFSRPNGLCWFKGWSHKSRRAKEKRGDFQSSEPALHHFFSIMSRVRALYVRLSS